MDIRHAVQMCEVSVIDGGWEPFKAADEPVCL